MFHLLTSVTLLLSHPVLSKFFNILLLQYLVYNLDKLEGRGRLAFAEYPPMPDAIAGITSSQNFYKIGIMMPMFERQEMRNLDSYWVG